VGPAVGQDSAKKRNIALQAIELEASAQLYFCPLSVSDGPHLFSEFLATGSIPSPARCSESGGSGTGSTQPREYNSGATWKKKRLRCRKLRIWP
jgi:hypothetical protein